MITKINKVLLLFIFLSLNFLFVRNIVAGETIDVLDFFISKHAYGVSNSPVSLGFTEIISGNSKYVVKNTSKYEYYTWDDNYIYLKQDTSVGDFPINGGIANSYKIYPGLWMKRRMQVGERIDSPSQVDWFDRTCGVVKHWDFWPYFTYLESHKKFDVGGDLGVQDVIVLQYNYGSGYEKFYYSNEWGWVRWEEWDTDTKTMKRLVNFNQFKPYINIKNTSCGVEMPRSLTPSPTVSGKRSDANNDGNVDGLDYVVWLNNYGNNLSGKRNGDFNNDKYVDGQDYVMWLNDVNK